MKTKDKEHRGYGLGLLVLIVDVMYHRDAP